jgi:hypothetical protein
MSYEITIEIPIESHLKKMVHYYNEGEYFKIRYGRCPYSSIIYNTLQRSTIKEAASKGVHYNDKLKVIIPGDLVKENKFFLNAKGITKVNSTLKGMFQEKMIDYLTDRCEQKGDVEKYIQKFLDKYGISEDEVTLSSAKKLFWRFRKNTEGYVNANLKMKKNPKQPRRNTKVLNINGTPGEQQSLFGAL